MKNAEMIQPALTAEEWAKVAEFPWPDYRYDLVFGLPDQHRDSYRHAHAAVALYGQPFGFTLRMVRLIEMAADAHAESERRGVKWVCDTDAVTADEWQHLTAVIAALLPPE